MFLKKIVLIYFSKQFIYFVLCGSTAAFLHWSTRIVLRNFLGFKESAILAYLIGITIAFLLYRRHVFPFSNAPVRKQSTRFLIINFSFAPFVLYAFYYITLAFYKMGFALYVEEISYAIALTLPPLITFLLYKFFAFK